MHSASSDVSCSSGASGLPKCSLASSPIAGLKVSSSQLQQQAVPFFPRFVFQPGTVTKTVVTPSAGVVNVTGAVTKTIARSAPVVVAIQGVNALYKKYVFCANEVGTIPFDVSTPSLSAGSQLFFTVYADSNASGALSTSTPPIRSTSA